MSVDTEIRNINYKISQLQKTLTGGGSNLIFVSTESGSLTGSQLNLIGGSNIETSISDNSVQINLNGVVPQPAIYSGSYPSPQYLAPTISGSGVQANSRIVPIHNVTNDTIWFIPEAANVATSGSQATIGLRGQTGTAPGSVSRGGGDAVILGGDGGQLVGGGSSYVLGGKGGEGAMSQNGGDGGNTYIRGGIPGLAGMGASAGLSGSVYIGDSATRRINIGNNATTTEVYGSLTGSVISASTNIIAPAITGSEISSSNFIGWGNRIVRPYGAFCDLTTQTASATTVANPMRFTTTEEALGVSIVSGSRITFAYAGTYNIQFSAQIDKTSGGASEIDIWFAETGSNIPRSNTTYHIQGNSAKAVAALNFVRTFPSGSYAEIYWRTDDTDVVLLYENSASSPTRPEIPSTILTITQV